MKKEITEEELFKMQSKDLIEEIRLLRSKLNSANRRVRYYEQTYGPIPKSKFYDG